MSICIDTCRVPLTSMSLFLSHKLARRCPNPTLATASVGRFRYNNDLIGLHFFPPFTGPHSHPQLDDPNSKPAKPSSVKRKPAVDGASSSTAPPAAAPTVLTAPTIVQPQKATTLNITTADLPPQSGFSPPQAVPHYRLTAAALNVAAATLSEAAAREADAAGPARKRIALE